MKAVGLPIRDSLSVFSASKTFRKPLKKMQGIQSSYKKMIVMILILFLALLFLLTNGLCPHKPKLPMLLLAIVCVFHKRLHLTELLNTTKSGNKVIIF